MAIHDKDYYYRNLSLHLDKILSIHFKATGQDDFTDTSKYRSTTKGNDYLKWMQRNGEILELVEKVKTAYRHSQSRWR